jgi:hypothetical protein
MGLCQFTAAGIQTDGTKKENPATVRYARRGSGPFFFVRECQGRGDNAS